MEFRKFRGTDKYLTSSALESAVNCALALERPLLVRGEPGTGKTQLAEAIASGLGLRLIHWPVKSTTRAQDGLYVYDTVQRLYDSRFGDGDVKDIRRYIRHGPLGQAFASRDRVVLLIDEIDKADLEFPNDLLPERAVPDVAADVFHVSVAEARVVEALDGVVDVEAVLGAGRGLHRPVDQPQAQPGRDCLRELRLSRSRFAAHQERPLQREGAVHGRLERRRGEVLVRAAELAEFHRCHPNRSEA